MEKMRMETPDLTEANVEKIGALFPNCITETKDENGKPKKAINFDLLRQMLSADVVEGDEAYEFTWVGKKAAIVEANKPIRKTLRPCPEKSVNWDSTENLYIEGDNLEVLKLIQESYMGKIKIIYIDPPYNTGNDFIYRDSFTIPEEEYEDQVGLFSDDGDKLFKNSDSNGRFHSDWCSMMYSRLMLARNVLSSDGLIFISIGSAELDNLIKICDEIFGRSNRAGIVSRQMKTGNNQGKFFTQNTDYIVVYAKSEAIAEPLKDDMSEELIEKVYNKVQESGPRKGERYRTMGLFQASLKHGGSTYPIQCPDGEMVITPNGLPWRWNEATFKKGLENDEIVFIKTNSSPLVHPDTGEKASWNIYTKIWLNSRMEAGQLPSDLILKFENRHAAKELSALGIPFDFPKPVALIKYLLHLITDTDYYVMDFFAGSSTTAEAVMQLNAEDGGHRKFIMVQLPEACELNVEASRNGFMTICDIGRERIKRAAEKIVESNPLFAGEKDFGFRTLRVADSNMKDVYYSADEYSQGLLAKLEENIKEDRTDLDLLFGCLLDWGLPLSLPHTFETIDGCTVHSYNDGDLIACFNNNVTESVINTIAGKHPLRAVFRDDGFADSPAKINMWERFKLLSPDTTVKII